MKVAAQLYDNSSSLSRPSAGRTAPEVETLLRNLREAKSDDARTRAIDALEKAVRQLRKDVNVTKKPAS